VRGERQPTTQHIIQLRSLRALLPQQAKLPIANVDEIVAVVQFPAMLKTKRLQSLVIKGGEVDVGDALMSLTHSSTPTVEAKPTTPKPDPMLGWRVDELTIADTAITLQRIAPGLPPPEVRPGLPCLRHPARAERTRQATL